MLTNPCQFGLGGVHLLADARAPASLVWAVLSALDGPEADLALAVRPPADEGPRLLPVRVGAPRHPAHEEAAGTVLLGLDEAGYRVTLPGGEPFELPRAGGRYATDEVVERLVADRRARSAHVRFVVEPAPGIPHQAVAELLGALRRPVEGRTLFPDVHLRGAPAAQ